VVALISTPKLDAIILTGQPFIFSLTLSNRTFILRAYIQQPR